LQLEEVVAEVDHLTMEFEELVPGQIQTFQATNLPNGFENYPGVDLLRHRGKQVRRKI